MSTVIEKIEILSTENSTTATTGSIQTLGGIGAASNVFVGGTTFTNTIAESTLNNGVSVDGVLLKDNGVVIPTGGSIIGAAGTTGATLTLTSGIGTTAHGDVVITTPTSDVAGSQGNISITGGITSAGTNASNIAIRSGSNATTSGKIDITTPVSTTGSQIFIGTGLASAPLLSPNELRMTTVGILALNAGTTTTVNSGTTTSINAGTTTAVNSTTGTNIITVAKTLTNAAAHIQILSGNHSGSVAASNVLISSGKNTGTGASGNLYMTALTNATNTAGGSIQIKAGNATATTPAIAIQNSVNIESTSTNPLSVSMVSTGGVGIKTATTEYSFHVSGSGKLIHTGGTVAPTSITPAAGRIVHVEGGATFTGVTDTLGSHYTEAATVPQAVAAGRGTIWVRNDTPNTPMFTDDAGNDRVLWRAPSVMEKIGTTLAIGNANLVFDQQLLPISGSSTVAAATTADNFIYRMSAPTNDSAVFNVRANSTIDKDIPHSMSSFSAVTKRIIGSDTVAADYYGSCSVIYGDYVVVGAGYDDDGGADSGSAYVYYRHAGGSNMWGQTKKLVSDDPQANAGFGYNSAIYGDYIVVGSARHTSNSGIAEIFHKNQGGAGNWGWIKTLTADFPTAGDYFGNSVAIYEDHIVVGASGAVSNTGEAFIYRKDSGGANNWGLVKKITHTGAAVGDSFGDFVTINNDIVAVSAQFRNSITPPAVDAGSVILFGRNTGGPNNWGQDVEIFAPDREAGAVFGSSIAVQDGVMVIGNEIKIVNGVQSGAAYIYEYNEDSGWVFTDQITCNNVVFNSNFGYRVAIHNGLICTSSVRRINVFKKDKNSDLWYEIADMELIDQTLSMEWVSMDDQHIVFGAAGATIGSAYIARYSMYESVHVGTESMNINYNTVLRPNEIGQVSFNTSIDYTGENLYRNYIPVEKALTSNVLNPSDQFGHAVSVDGDYAVVSLVDDSTVAVNAGTVHVYWKNQGGNGNWGLLTTLVASPTLPAGARFGSSVAIYGDNIIVGAREENSGTGAVYIFNKNTGGVNNWGFVVRRVGSGLVPGSRYGYSVDIIENYAVVGAPINGDGAVFILEKDYLSPNSWSERKKILADDGNNGDLFGASVAITLSLILGTIVAVGAPGVSTSTGAVYVFDQNNPTVNNWGQRIKKFVVPQANNGDEYGYSVAIDGDYIIAGAPGSSSYDGAAYILHKDAGGANYWGTVKDIIGDPLSGSVCGQSVSINGRYAAVGNIADSGVGSVAVYYNTEVNNIWVYSASLKASDGVQNDQFGHSVGINGSNVITGALNKNSTGGAYMMSVGGRKLNSSLSINRVQ